MSQAQEKKTVCTITINSADEAETFKQHLSPDEFSFIELTESAEKANNKWLDNACDKKINCDVLIVSGHFAGSFFGSSGIHLAIEELETRSCNAKCNGIFKHPKEVFLFGCNTLAGKTKDLRSPEEYRRRLLEEGFSSQQAEQVVAFRYSPIGQSFSDRMARSFPGVPQIIGFSSIGPSGPHAKHMIDRYLKSTSADYAQNLGQHNSVLSFFKNTFMVQAIGEEPKTNKTPACYFNDKNISNQDKLVTIDSILRSDNIPFLMENVFYIDNFISDSEKTPFTPSENEIFRRFSQDTKGKQEILSLLDKPMGGLMSVQINLLKFTKKIGWIDLEEFRKRIQKVVDIKSILRSPVSVEITDQICSLKVEVPLAYQDIPEVRWHEQSRANFIRLLGCLNPQDLEIHHELVKIIQANESLPFDMQNAVWTLTEIKPQDIGIHQALAKILVEHTDEEVRFYATLILGFVKSHDADVLQKLSRALIEDNAPKVRLETANTLGGIKPQEVNIHLALVKAAFDDDPVVSMHAVRALEAIQPQNKRVHRALTKTLVENKNRNVAKTAAWALGAIKSQDINAQKALANAVAEHVNTSTEYTGFAEIPARALAEIKPKSPEIRAQIQKILNETKNETVRRDLQFALGK